MYSFKYLFAQILLWVGAVENVFDPLIDIFINYFVFFICVCLITVSHKLKGYAHTYTQACVHTHVALK